MRPRVQVMLNRRPAADEMRGASEHGWVFNVTLINNDGVDKGPRTPPVINETAAVSLVLKSVGASIVAAAGVFPPRATPIPVANGDSVRVSIPAGGVVLLTVSTAVARGSPQRSEAAAPAKTDDPSSAAAPTGLRCNWVAATRAPDVPPHGPHPQLSWAPQPNQTAFRIVAATAPGRLLQPRGRCRRSFRAPCLFRMDNH
jgi:hypothetical protein